MGEAPNQVLAYAAGKDVGVRASMRNGDVLFFRGRGILSWLIRHATHCDYSHAGLLFRYSKRVYCLEAVGKGVRLAPVSRLLDHYPDGIYYCGLGAEEPTRKTALGFGFQQLSQAASHQAGPALVLLGAGGRCLPRRWFSTHE